MTVVRQMEIRANMKDYLDRASAGEPIFVPRKGNRNVYIISQAEYETMQKAKRNAEYLMMLDQSRQQLETGDVVMKSLRDLRTME